MSKTYNPIQMGWYTFRSIIFSILFAIVTVVVSIVFAPFLVFRCKVLYWCGIVWCRISLFLLRIICGITYEVRGRENLPKGKYIIASKHQSAFETVAFWDVFYIPTYVLKKELTYIPFFGIYLVRMKMICINRSAGASAIKKIVSEVGDHLEEGRKIIIYPEGTRVKPGIRSEKYNPGVAAIYSNCEVPVVPVAINSGMFWQNKKWTKLPGKVVIDILPPIDPGLSKRDFLEKLNNQIEERSLKLSK